MMTWLAGMGAKGLARWVWIVGIGVVVMIAIVAVKTFIGTAFDKTENLGREAGRQEAVIEGQNQTLDQIGDANDAEQDLRSGGERSAVRYDECLRNSRRRDACERYNPDAGQ